MKNTIQKAKLIHSFKALTTKCIRATLAGEIKVAVGQTDAIIPFRIPIISGTSAKIVKIGYGIGGGTNAAFKMQRTKCILRQ